MMWFMNQLLEEIKKNAINEIDILFFYWKC